MAGNSAIPPGFRFVILALFISHGVSFFYNYLYKREYASANYNKLTGQPYLRVIISVIVIAAGVCLILAVGSPIPALITLVVVKTIIDVCLHLCEHGKMQNLLWPLE